MARWMNVGAYGNDDVVRGERGTCGGGNALGIQGESRGESAEAPGEFVEDPGEFTEALGESAESLGEPVEDLGEYERFLRGRERTRATIEKYMRDIKSFFRWMGEREVGNGCEPPAGEDALDTRDASAEARGGKGPARSPRCAQGPCGGSVSPEDVTSWKAHLLDEGFAPSSINSKLAALNGYFAFTGRPHLKARFLKVQRRVFSDPARDLTKKDYERLLSQARREGNEKIALVMEAICSTGMRVSEVAYLTVDAVRKGRIEVALKGKIRTILIPVKLREKLVRYINSRRIARGPVFLSSSTGKALSRYSIWAQMKELCKRARVLASKVFPHNLRHLFARTFYKATGDIVKLADVLGHSSIETTRIYLVTPGVEHARIMERLCLVI